MKGKNDYGEADNICRSNNTSIQFTFEEENDEGHSGLKIPSRKFVKFFIPFFVKSFSRKIP